jgi:2-polyprenyl-6-methoxyphenol hydroxylase-like FAD-dependent oxidoreductase
LAAKRLVKSRIDPQSRFSYRVQTVSGKTRMRQPVETIVIVGGGTAGWITASLLKARFGSSLGVTVVESDRVPTVGVGEASLPVLRDFLRALRIDEREFLKACDASLKAGLRFANWRTTKPDDVYYHLFFGADENEPLLRLIGTRATAAEEDLWHDLLEQGLINGRDFMIDLTIAGQLIKRNRASRRNGDEPYQSPLGYAYHLDAKLFAEFLRNWSIQRGVVHLVDHVTSVQVQENGDICLVTTENQGEVVGDFFVDCTGFRGVLINEALQEPFEPCRPWLLCDSAVAIQLPHAQIDGEIAAHTCLDALSAGWAWRIPLFSRQGTGYVYSREFLTNEEAERELRSRLGPGADASTAHHLRMRVGKNRRAWVNNCLSVGLAAGFLEALESTSIAFIQRGVAKFLTCFRNRCFEAQDQERYNREMTEDFEECRDFLIIHYCLSEREDSPFWRECRRTEIPDRVKALLEEWRERATCADSLKGKTSAAFFLPCRGTRSFLAGQTGRRSAVPRYPGPNGAGPNRAPALSGCHNGRQA